MQSVNSAFTAEERDSIRSIKHNLQVSWKKQSTLGNRSFTIGVSTIGGDDVIGANPGALVGPTAYKYFDETDYVNSMHWESSLNMPIGGLAQGLAEFELDNTSGRFWPDYMGGVSELSTSIQPGKPVIMAAGFDVGGISQTVPQFSGYVKKHPDIDKRQGYAHFSLRDYVDFFEDRQIDEDVMFTAQTADTIIERLLLRMGMSTAQFDLDPGLNEIPFGYIPANSKLSNVLHDLVRAEQGNFYQDEMGIYKFENRQHWNQAPYNQVQRVISTAQVLEVESPDDSHLINTVEIIGKPREKRPNALIYQSSGFGGTGALEIPPMGTAETWVSFDDPMLSIDTPQPITSSTYTSNYVVNSQADGGGSDATGSVSVASIVKFATAAKIVFSNSSGSTVYLTNLDLWGRAARKAEDIYVKDKLGASVTAYQEFPYKIESDYIQSESWALSLAQVLLNDFGQPENVQRITIRAIPELQKGDLISWQGRYWRVFGIKSSLSPSTGYIQELDILQRTLVDYFRIGISLIGGTDIIAP